MPTWPSQVRGRFWTGPPAAAAGGGGAGGGGGGCDWGGSGRSQPTKLSKLRTESLEHAFGTLVFRVGQSLR